MEKCKHGHQFCSECHTAGHDALKKIIEIYAGMDGFIPETAPEAYQKRIIEQMYEQAVGGLGETTD